MMNKQRLAILSVFGLVVISVCISSRPAKVTAQNSSHDPTWWSKYEFIRDNGGDASPLTTSSTTANGNVDVSNECGPQSETFITISQNKPKTLAAGSNEIFRLPMRGYYSTNGGSSWGGVDLPLPPAIGNNGIDFGSDPTLAFDTRGNVFYGYIVVFFGNGTGVNGTEMAVARSTDGGKTYPSVNFFSFENGANRFRDNVYVAWDAASGGSTGGGVRVGASSDHGATFNVTRADDPSGPGRSIG